MRKGCLPAAGLGMLSLVALLVAFVALLNTVGCCAIECDKYPEKCAENERRQQNASMVLLGALLVSAGCAGGALYQLRKRR